MRVHEYDGESCVPALDTDENEMTCTHGGALIEVYP